MQKYLPPLSKTMLDHLCMQDTLQLELEGAGDMTGKLMRIVADNYSFFYKDPVSQNIIEMQNIFPSRVKINPGVVLCVNHLFYLDDKLMLMGSVRIVHNPNSSRYKCLDHLLNPNPGRPAKAS